MAMVFDTIHHPSTHTFAGAGATKKRSGGAGGSNDTSSSSNSKCCFSFEGHEAFRDAMDDLGLLTGLGQQEVLTLVSVRVFRDFVQGMSVDQNPPGLTLRDDRRKSDKSSAGNSHSKSDVS